MITQLLFLLIENQLGINNDYFSGGITSTEPKTIRFQNGSWEAEFYNKAVQEPRSGIKCRLELRRKRLSSMHEENKEIRVFENWMSILKDATSIPKGEYDSILNEINSAIMFSYELDVMRGDYYRRDYNSMIQRYRYHIFSGHQLTDLFWRLGYKHPDVMASKYKKKHRGMEYYTLKDVQRYAQYIKQVADKFYFA